MKTPDKIAPAPGPGYDIVTARAQLLAQAQKFHDRALIYAGEILSGREDMATDFTADMIEDMQRADRRKRAAGEVLIVLFGGGLYAPDSFWRTDLGQLVYEAYGWPGNYLTISQAGEVLRVSRGRVHQLLQDGKLDRSDVVPGSPISSATLRERWRQMRELYVPVVTA